MALGRARAEAVKKYAQLVVDTHGKLLEDGNKLAKLKRLPVPKDAAGADDPLPQPLRAAPDERFDRAYVGWVLEAQGEAYQAARRAASEARDPNGKAFAANAASHIEKQLEIARELAQSLDAPPRKTPLG